MKHLPDPPTFRATLVRLGVALVLITLLIVATINYSTYTPPAKATQPQSAQPPPVLAFKNGKKPGQTVAAAAPESSNVPPAQVAVRPATPPRTSTSNTAPAPTTPVLTDDASLSGSRFTDIPLNPLTVPVVTSIPLPRTDESYAIWGSLGTDDQGLIWTAISSDGREGSSATLISYDPDEARALWEGNVGGVARGRVIDELQKTNLYKERMGQAKIHSRIVQGSDGYLYFTSQDEQGESTDGFANPTWGGWLWRMRAPDYQWEPLFHADQGLIAVAGYGTDIYALGYHNHILHHFDTRTAKHTQVVVGSARGHISRNFMVDRMGHAFVPRVTQGLLHSDPLTVELVQYDTQLRKVGTTKLEHYLTPNPADSHGVISFVNMQDGSIIFATHHGYLYRINAPVQAGRVSAVTPIGFFHPQGERYTPTMHTYDGRRYLMGVVKAEPQEAGKPAFEWVVYDLYLNQSKALPLEIPLPETHSALNLLVYGSMTRDMKGDFYIVGTHLNARLPLLLKLSPRMD